MDQTQSDEIKALYALAQDICKQAQKFKNREKFAVLGLDDRKKLGVAFRQTLVETQRLLELLNVICSYCRQTGGEFQGECSQCGQEVCSLCGVEIQGKWVHADICARYFEE